SAPRPRTARHNPPAAAADRGTHAASRPRASASAGRPRRTPAPGRRARRTGRRAARGRAGAPALAPRGRRPVPRSPAGAPRARPPGSAARARRIRPRAPRARAGARPARARASRAPWGPRRSPLSAGIRSRWAPSTKANPWLPRAGARRCPPSTDQPLAQPAEEIAHDAAVGLAELHLDHVLVAGGELHGLEAFDGGRLGAEKPDVAQVVDAGDGVARRVGLVKGGGNLLEAPVTDELRELGVDLAGVSQQPAVRVAQRRDP